MGTQDRDWYKKDLERRSGKQTFRRPIKAEWDDVPNHLRYAKKPSYLSKLAVAGFIGAVVTVGALKLGVLKLPMLEQQVEQPPAAAAQSYSTNQQVSAQPARTLEQAFWDRTNSRKEQERQRQTDFNDKNYVPKAPQNIVETSNMSNGAGQSERPARQTTRTVDHEAEWVNKWSGGGAYLAKWTAINNRIDGGSVCANHKRGSIDYRECRKGAKQYFKDQCKAWDERYESSRSDQSDQMRERYCSAASSFSPMG